MTKIKSCCNVHEKPSKLGSDEKVKQFNNNAVEWNAEMPMEATGLVRHMPKKYKMEEVEIKPLRCLWPATYGTCSWSVDRYRLWEDTLHHCARCSELVGKGRIQRVRLSGKRIGHGVSRLVALLPHPLWCQIQTTDQINLISISISFSAKLTVLLFNGPLLLVTPSPDWAVADWGGGGHSLRKIWQTKRNAEYWL